MTVGLVPHSSLRKQWIGVNTEYLTDVVYTTTVDDQPSVTTAPAAVVAITATASGGGLVPGDVSIALSPKLVDVLNDLATEAETSCGARRKRQTCNVNERFAQRVYEELSPGGRLEFVDTGALTTIPMLNAPEIANTIRGAKVPLSIFLELVVLWNLRGKLSAWTIAVGSNLAGGGDDDHDDACPADAPRGVDAVSTYQAQVKARLLQS